MKKLILLILFIPSFCFSQRKIDTSFWAIKFNPTSLIDVLVIPSLDLGIERRFYRISLEANFAKQIYLLPHSDSFPIKPIGYKGSIEIKYFLKGNLKGAYLSCQPFFRIQKYSTQSTYYSKLDSTFKYPIKDDFTVNYFGWGLNLKAGYQVEVKKNLFIEIYMGGGFLQRNVKNAEQNFDKTKNQFRTVKDLPPDIAYQPDFDFSSGGYLNISLGLKLGYIIH